MVCYDDLKEPFKYLSPNRLVQKAFLISCLVWENYIELIIRTDREWTCLKGAKRFVSMTSGKLWSISPPNLLVQKVFLLLCFARENHIDLIIRTVREWAWFEDSKHFFMITSTKPWNIFPQNGWVKKAFLVTDVVQQGKNHIDHRQTWNL